MLTTYIDHKIVPSFIIHPDHIIDTCNAFADNMVRAKKKFYKLARKANISALRSQIYIGKLAEFFVASYMSQTYDFQYVLPDTTIYSTNQSIVKGFDPDLFYKQQNIALHIKSFNNYSAGKYPESYCFQPNDPLIARPAPTSPPQPSPYSDPTLAPQHNQNASSGQPEAFVILVRVESYGACLRAVLPVRSVVPLLRNPLKRTLSKKVIYFGDLGSLRKLCE